MNKRKLHYLSPRDRAWAGVRGVLLYVVCIGWACTAIIPMLWVFINSFKGSNEILMNSIALPKEWTFTNYVTMANYPGTNLVRSFFNSLVMWSWALFSARGWRRIPFPVLPISLPGLLRFC